MNRKPLVISLLILAVLLTAGFLSDSTGSRPKVSRTNFFDQGRLTQETGLGISVPACGSSVAGVTCIDGFTANVTISGNAQGDACVIFTNWLALYLDGDSHPDISGPPFIQGQWCDSGGNFNFNFNVAANTRHSYWIYYANSWHFVTSGSFCAPVCISANIWAAPGSPPTGPASDGPIQIPIGTSATISWTSSGASSCSVTKNGSAVCGMATCSGLSHAGETTNALSSPPTSYRYTLNCNGVTDSVDVNIVAACNDTLDNDGDNRIDMIDPGCLSSSDNDEANRYLCQSGACVSQEGSGQSCGNCTYNNTYVIGSNPATPLPLSSRICALTQCNDCSDNDGDAKIDFPRDLGCTSVNDNNEANLPDIFKECRPDDPLCS